MKILRITQKLMYLTRSKYMYSNWKKGFSLFKDATKIEFTSSSLFRYNNSYYADVKITYSEQHESYVGISLEENRNWSMQATHYTQLPSYAEEPETEFTIIFNENLKTMYEYFVSNRNPVSLYGLNAIDIVGLYFYAGERGDFDTQYDLFYYGEDSQVVPREQYFTRSKRRSTVEDEGTCMKQFRSKDKNKMKTEIGRESRR